MKIRHLLSLYKNKNGSAFLYVILILMLLSSITLAFLSDTLHYIKYASNYKYKNKSYYIAKSGIKLAAYFISEYGSNPVTYQELLNKTSIYKYGFPILGGYMKLNIVSNDSKFNINQLIFSDNEVNKTEYAELQRLFNILGISSNILQNIVYFMQKHQLNYKQLELKFNSTKKGFIHKEYLSTISTNPDISVLLNTEYKNPFLNIRDLMLVRNMKYKYYYILKHFLTCDSSGLININTASYQTIESLSPMISKSSAQELVEYRAVNPLASLAAIANVPGFNSSILESIVNQVEITSNFYLIKSYGGYKSGSIHIKSLYYINNMTKYKIREFIS